ncbi:hypothetical protein EOD42_25645, partial [Rhodovarius crocodyli]
MGGLIPDPASLGMDFMLVAFSAALMMGMWRSRADLWPVLAALPPGGMVGILAPVLRQGRIAECAGLAVVVLAMRLFGSDLAAALAGVA